MVAVAPAGAEGPAAEVREDPAGSEAPGESGSKVTRKGGRKETVAKNAPGGTNVCKRTNHMVTPTGTVSAVLRRKIC